jgi:Tol biopolymer transport system component
MLISLGRHYILGFINSGTLARVSSAGGAHREILENIEEADWNPKGEQIAIAREVRRRSRLEYPIGKVLYETDGWVSDVRFSRDGNQIAFFEHPTYGDNEGFVAVLDSSGKNKKSLTQRFAAAQGLAWSQDSKEIWFTARPIGGVGTNQNLYAVTLEGKQREVSNSPGTMILNDIAPNGDLLLSEIEGRRGINVFIDGENSERDLSWFDWSFISDITNDARMILLEEHSEGVGGRYTTFLRKTDGSPAIRLGEGRAGGLDPKAKWALMLAHPAFNRMFLLPTGAGEERTIPPHGVVYYEWCRWLPGGEEVMFLGHTKNGKTTLYRQDIHGGKPIPITNDIVLPWTVSRDENWFAANNREGFLTIYSLKDGRPLHATQHQGYWPICWTKDQTGIYVIRASDLPGKIYRFDRATDQITVWKELHPSDPAGIEAIGPLLITPDEKSYAYSYRRILGSLYLATADEKTK